MKPNALLEQVERLLDSRFGSHGGKDHYRTSPLAGRTLGVDVFREKGLVGHVRVHAFNVSREEANTLLVRAEKRLTVPAVAGCRKCQGIPSQFPAWYAGSAEEKGREYFGFQWHSPELSKLDLETIELAVEWLRELIPAAPAPKRAASHRKAR